MLTLAFLMACSSTEPIGTTPGTTAPPPTTTAPPPTTARTHPGCAADGHEPPHLVEMLASHETWISVLDDDRITDERLLVTGASVPDGLWWQSVVHIWWVNASDHTVHHGTVDNLSGELIDLGPIVVDGEVFSGMVDPDAVLIDADTVGLTVLDGFMRRGDPGPICHLRSTDGQEFTTHSTLLDVTDRFDPSVAIVDGEWWLALGVLGESPSTEVHVGTPEDGFTMVVEVDGAVPDLSYEEGDFRLLTCNLGELSRYESIDGREWKYTGSIRSTGCDPSTIVGTAGLFLFKREPPGSGTEQPPQDPPLD
jgi:hypothetical protein